jgi:hypothetical protein
VINQHKQSFTPLYARHKPNTNVPGGGKKGGDKNEGNSNGNDSSQEEDDPVRKRQKERNWIEKSSPTGLGGALGEDDIEEYTLKLHGPTFQIGALSQRFYDALMTNAERRFGSPRSIPKELLPIYKSYAMDMAAKEAVKAALQENGLELVEVEASSSEEETEAGAGMPGTWGVLEEIRILKNDNPEDEDVLIATADNTEYAIREQLWEPGQAYSFIVRHVKGKLREVSLKSLLSAWGMEDMAGELGVDMKDDTDPKLPLESVKDYIDVDDEEDDDDDEDDGDDYADDDKQVISQDDNDELFKDDPYKLTDAKTLQELGKDCEERANAVPTRAVAVGFAGGVGVGYDIVKSGDVLKESSNDNVMQALEQHGCLVVDTIDSSEKVKALDGMWKATDCFFNEINNTSGSAVTPPGMSIAKDAGSRHAAVGYATYDSGAMQFLETRLTRQSATENERDDKDKNKLVPSEIAGIITSQRVHDLINGNAVLTNIGKDVAKVAIQSALLLQQEGESSSEDATTRANLLVDALLDDATNRLGDDQETTISMSPHRMCRYSDNGKGNQSASAREVFGAHTDTSFVTVVPCAAVSGLEIYDAAAGSWIRPELMARRHWENERLEQNLDLKLKDGEGEDSQPWHSRYVVCVPGELLQLYTNNRIRAAVHRVVAATGGESRVSAPVLLRARTNAIMDVPKYFGVSKASDAGPLLESCQDLTMEDIHNALQPSGVVDE